jgi:hypothetical protein
LLRQIDKTTDDGARGGLTQALKALAGKLDKVQTNRASEWLFRETDKTTDSFSLAQALEALEGRLTEAQASQAFNSALRRIGQMTASSTLSLAPVLDTLALQLTESQASEAFNSALLQMEQTNDSGALWNLSEALGALAERRQNGCSAHR